MTPKARLSFSRQSSTGVIGGFHQKKLVSFVRFSRLEGNRGRRLSDLNRTCNLRLRELVGRSSRHGWSETERIFTVQPDRPASGVVDAPGKAEDAALCLVDVLPALSSNREIARHIEEYLGDQSAGLPAGIRRVLGWTSRSVARGAACGPRSQADGACVYPRGRAGGRVGELRAMRDRSAAFTVDLFGEAAVSEREAGDVCHPLSRTDRSLADAAATWLRSEHLDSDDRGPIPAVNVSVKISALFSQ